MASLRLLAVCGMLAVATVGAAHAQSATPGGMPPPPGMSLAESAAMRFPQPVRVDKWGVGYPATEEIWVYGSGPRSLKKKEPPPKHHIPAVPKDDRPFGRIVR